MKKLIVILTLLILASVSVSGQIRDTSINIKNTPPHDFSYLKKWKYFKLKRAISVKIIYHLPAQTACGVYMEASSTIAVTQKGDTIRILDLCNMNDYKIGQLINVEPAEPPACVVDKKNENCWAGAPFTLVKNEKTDKFEPTTFDLTVPKTTYGTIRE